MTHLFVILDRSGSMQSIWTETVGGLNSYLDKLRKDKNKYQLTLTGFDNEIERPVEAKSLAEVQPQDYESLSPRGMTALYDAIGSTVSDLKAQVKAKDKALVLILTDGLENASQEWKKAAVAKLIKELEKTNWTFTYLGANQDSWANAQGLGFKAGNVSNYNATPTGTVAAFASMSANTSNLASMQAQNSSSFYEADKEKLENA